MLSVASPVYGIIISALIWRNYSLTRICQRRITQCNLLESLEQCLASKGEVGTRLRHAKRPARNQWFNLWIICNFNQTFLKPHKEIQKLTELNWYRGRTESWTGEDVLGYCCVDSWFFGYLYSAFWKNLSTALLGCRHGIKMRPQFASRRISVSWNR